MKIALVTGASGCGKTYVADALRADFESVSYDRLMRDSIERAFPDCQGDRWDKQIWLDNKYRLDLPTRARQLRLAGRESGRSSWKAGNCARSSGATRS